MDAGRNSQQPRNRNTALLRKLSAAVNGHAATATFACGGSVPIVDGSAGLGNALGSAAVCLPVKIRCDAPLMDDDVSITFPRPANEECFNERLNALLNNCQPATFGLGGRDVMDEGYRKASKLDPSQFSSNFHPHDCGILDSIQQVLFPSTVRGGLQLGIGPQGIRAELYKLNIYSGPSGKFLPHVDTPRGPTQFGSLVVCLPCQHQGGTLRVKHRGQTIDYNWAHDSPCSIQWAAFYSDCEHEVFEVTADHRVTLTYNLYSRQFDGLERAVHVPHQLPLYDIARDILLEPSFMQQGGLIGFFCHHQYAHAHQSGRKSLPHAFKGVDLAVYSVFRSLRLPVGIHPVVKNRSGSMGGISMKQLLRDNVDVTVQDHVEFLMDELRIQEEECGDGSDYYDEEEDDCTTIVGKGLHGPTFDNSFDEDDREPVSAVWPHEKVPRIVWMNDPSHKEFAHAGLAYGNEAELKYRFSAAAIIVIVTPASARIPAHSTGGALSTGRPPVEAYSRNTMSTSTVSANTTGGDTAVFDLTSDTEDEDQASPMTVS